MPDRDLNTVKLLLYQSSEYVTNREGSEYP